MVTELVSPEEDAVVAIVLDQGRAADRFE